MFKQEVPINNTKTNEAALLSKCRGELKKATSALLDELESTGLKEEQICEMFKVSRMGLYKHRVKIGCPNKARSDKGKYKEGSIQSMTPDEFKVWNRENMQRYIADYKEKHGVSYNRGRNGRHQQTILKAMLGDIVDTGDYVIHHLDGNPANNHPCNLVACLRGYHRATYHSKEMEQLMKKYPTPTFSNYDEYKEWLDSLTGAIVPAA